MERNKKLTIRLSEEEHNRIKELTEKSEYKSMSEYMRETILYSENKIVVESNDANTPTNFSIDLGFSEPSIRRSGDSHYYITFQFDNKDECAEAYEKVDMLINNIDEEYRGDIKIIKPLSKKRFMIYCDFINYNEFSIHKYYGRTILECNLFLTSQ